LSIYQRVFKLPPASVLTLGVDAAAVPRRSPPAEGVNDGFQLEHYWSYRDVMQEGLADPITDETDALRELEGTLAAAIQAQSMADVPVGAFLSGGIDSS